MPDDNIINHFRTQVYPVPWFFKAVFSLKEDGFGPRSEKCIYVDQKSILLTPKNEENSKHRSSISLRIWETNKREFLTIDSLIATNEQVLQIVKTQEKY
jgi:hypothetical protein